MHAMIIFKPPICNDSDSNESLLEMLETFYGRFLFSALYEMIAFKLFI